MFHTKLFSKEFELKLTKYLSRHPFGAFLLLFAGLPTGVFLAVSCFTIVLVYPACLLMGLM